MSNATPDSDYPLSEVPNGARKGLFSTAILLFGFTFFTATMFAGGKIGMAFDFTTLLWAAVIGNLLLGLYAAVLGLIACRSGLNSVLMGRFCFGEVGSKLSDVLLGFTQIGWYAWGTATIAIVLVKILGLPESLTIPLMVLFGFGFCLTAFVGYKGLDLLSRIAVPAMLVLLVVSLWIATRDIGGLSGLLAVEPKESMSLSVAITLVFGTFVSGATQATNWTRFAKSGRVAVLASLFGFFIGNGLMIVAGPTAPSSISNRTWSKSWCCRACPWLPWSCCFSTCAPPRTTPSTTSPPPAATCCAPASARPSPWSVPASVHCWPLVACTRC